MGRATFGRTALAAGAAAIGLAPLPALAWGHTGHVEISELAIATLPPELPKFLRTSASDTEVGQLGPEPDVSKTAGTIHDAERDAGHFIDVDDAGLVNGASPLSPLAATREAFDTAQRAGGSTQYAAGYLPYNIVDGWQQLRKDFAYFRADKVGLATATNDADRGFFQYQLELRRKLILRDIGVWSHYVGDGSQPLHVSVHYNGWGRYPNPQNFTQAHIHAQFEGAFVKQFTNLDDIYFAIKPYHDCGCPIEQRVVQYMQATASQVVPLYTLAKADPAPFTTPVKAEVRFVTQRLAAGAAELRDEIVDAWRSSATWTVGYPLINVADIESGKVHLTQSSYAGD